jgi:spore coat protein U-like protein
MRTQYFAQSAVATALLLAVSSSFADTTTDNLDISLTVQAACTVLSVTDVTDTVTVGTSGNHTSSGTVSVTCNNAHPYTIAMGGGTHLASGQRNVHDGVLTSIPYQIFRGGTATVWGSSGTAADMTYDVDAASAWAGDWNGTGTGAAQSYPYQVTFTLAGTEPAGVYTDTVLVTLEF